MQYKEIFRNYLLEKGLKLTRSRLAILDMVFDTHSHFDAEDLYQMIRTKDKNVSRATVYRTIPHLTDSGLVRKSMRQEGKDYYEHVFGHPDHLHLICTKCGKIIEQTDRKLEAAIKKIATNNGFEYREYLLSIKGLCPLCHNSDDNSTKGE
jgi:Fur family transcriptional regulator, ferric uptake regulator